MGALAKIEEHLHRYVSQDGRREALLWPITAHPADGFIDRYVWQENVLGHFRWRVAQDVHLAFAREYYADIRL